MLEGLNTFSCGPHETRRNFVLLNRLRYSLNIARIERDARVTPLAVEVNFSEFKLTESMNPSSRRRIY
jgi:hypothetical protein